MAEQVITMRKIALENFDDPAELPEFYAEAVEDYQVFMHHKTNSPCIYIDYPGANDQHLIFLDWLILGMKSEIATPIHHLDTLDREYVSACVVVSQDDLGEFLYCFARRRITT